MPSQIQYDFKSDNPFEFWTSNGSYKIHELSIAASGDPTRGNIGQFDVEFIEASYVYLSIKTHIPLSGSLKISGNIRVDQVNDASVALGANIAISPVRRSGVYVLSALSAKSDWVTQTFDAGLASREKAAKLVDTFLYGVETDDVGVWLDRIGLFVRGKPGGRIVFSLDQLQIEGDTPNPQTYRTQKEAAWTSLQDRLRKSLNDLAAPIFTAESYKIQDLIPLQNQLQNDTNRIFSDFAKNGFVTPEAFEKLRFFAETARHMDQQKQGDVDVYPWEPTSPIPILPKTNPIPASVGNELSIQACRGEYEPASFILRSAKKLPYVTISASDFSTTEGNVIPATVVDIRLVKCWFQAGSRNLQQQHKKILAPELLLKDNALVQVNLETRTNALRGFLNGKIQYFDITHPTSKVPPEAIINDASELQPFDLASDFNQQIWLTVQVPKKAKSGNYHGFIEIQSLGDSVAKLAFNIEVLPFELPPPVLEYAIYYRGKLVPAENATIGSEYKSETQYRLEMADLKAHGIDSPTLYQPFDPLLDRALDIRNDAGLSHDNLFLVSLQTKTPFDLGSLASLKKKFRKWKAVSDRKGYHHFYVYGIDEAKDDLIAEQLPAWQMVKANGGCIFVACPHHADTLSKSNLDIGILHGPFDRETALRWSQAGLKVFSYGNPQVGVENPGVYRSNYGFKLWASGYAGSMNYAYQHAFGDIWNDFDHPKYRDHVFSYPVTNGLISTIQWEGFREAIDDIRYLSAFIAHHHEPCLQLFSHNGENTSIDFNPSAIRKIISMTVIANLTE